MSSYIERFSLAGKTALVTGASKGIGIETYNVLADAGRPLFTHRLNAKKVVPASAI